MQPNLQIYPTAGALAPHLATLILATFARFTPTPASPYFVVALSGGSLPTTLGQALAPHLAAIDFTRWRFIFADERCVAHAHADSNYKACYDAFLKGIPGLNAAEQIVAINEALLGDPTAAASDYAARLPPGPIHLALLGMGPDGHTCSLFPGHRLMTETAIDSAEHAPTWPRVVAITDSPKPPAARITLGLAEIQHNALTVVYVTTGKGKAPVLGEIMAKGDKSGYPAAIARPLDGLTDGGQRRLVWMVDEEAASEVPVGVREKLAGKL